MKYLTDYTYQEQIEMFERLYEKTFEHWVEVRNRNVSDIEAAMDRNKILEECLKLVGVDLKDYTRFLGRLK